MITSYWGGTGGRRLREFYEFGKQIWKLSLFGGGEGEKNQKARSYAIAQI